ncbi:MAG: GxxExxY protein [Desulfobacterales bacterium]|nr:GxxExxY protein [Desulfobacterales bacterium]
MINEQYQYSELTGKIIGCAMEVHRILGNGFQEVIYQRAMAIEMTKQGLSFSREHEINPEIGEPYLKKIEVVLMGKNNEEALLLPPYLEQAYEQAEKFCNLLSKRVRSGGFIKTASI